MKPNAFSALGLGAAVYSDGVVVRGRAVQEEVQVAVQELAL
jgi:hypothetical protein